MTYTTQARQHEATGTISDFDEVGAFGVIDSDDGRMVLFNLEGIPASQHRCFRVGTRVQFMAHESTPAPRAVDLKIVKAPSKRSH
jgi:cold shock CspA family protein